MQIFGTHFQITLGDVRLIVGFNLESVRDGAEQAQS